MTAPLGANIFGGVAGEHPRPGEGAGAGILIDFFFQGTEDETARVLHRGLWLGGVHRLVYSTLLFCRLIGLIHHNAGPTIGGVPDQHWQIW